MKNYNIYIDLLRRKNVEDKEQLLNILTTHEKEEIILITYLNLYSYLYFRKNIDLFKAFTFIGFDGILLVKLLNFIGILKTTRLSFDMTSLAKQVFTIAEKKEKTLYLVGAKQIELERAIKNLLNKFRNLKIIGSSSGYFRNEKHKIEEIEKICNLNPDILIAGMGTGNQEKFLLAVKENGWKGIAFTCGGFIHQTALRLHYYPKWIDKYNLRALYRMIDEPKLIKRYLFIYPLGLSLFLWDVLNYFIKSK